MTEDPKLSKALLAENGLDSQGVNSEARIRYLETVQKDTRRLGRAEAAAIIAWIFHGFFFVANWIAQLPKMRWNYIPDKSSFFNFGFRFGITNNDPALLHVLDIFVFLLAIAATLRWLNQARRARSNETELRLAMIESEINRIKG